MDRKLKEKYISRIDELLLKSQDIERTKRYVQYFGDCVDSDIFDEWKTNVISILGNIITTQSIHYNRIEKIIKGNNRYGDFTFIKSTLKGIKSDFEQDFLEPLSQQIESSISCNYLDMAEELMAEKKEESTSYIPAAVLAGAVLENNLRSLCEKQNPPLETKKTNGKNKTMSPLIDELKKANIINEIKAKQLRSWADIRNAAAHGHHDEVDRKDVERMIDGITDFLASF
jgi:hypothetical protein